MEFFQRQDAFNVFDKLWPNDLLSLSSTCRSLRTMVNDYCANNKILNKLRISSSTKKKPAICRLVKYWLRHCLICNEEMNIKDCLNCKDEKEFVPQALKGYSLIPICDKCAYDWSYTKKITKTDAKSRYSLNENDLNGLLCIEKRNPRYRSAATMKLFYEGDVIEAAIVKHKLTTRTELIEFLKNRREKRATRTEEIRQRKQLSQEERRNALKDELEKIGLELRADSQIADFYITNSKRAFSLEKSVKLIRRAHIVHQHVGEYYSDLLDEAYEALKDERYNHERWTDMWQEEKFDAEKKAVKLFKKAKEMNVAQKGKCKCGRPLFEEAELVKVQAKMDS